MKTVEINSLGSYNPFVSVGVANNMGAGGGTRDAPDKCRLGGHGGNNAMG